MHGAADVAAATGAARGRPLTLLSAEGAGCFAGAGWFAALVAPARASGAQAVLDCSSLTGRVLETAAVGGIDAVIFTGPPAMAERLAVILAEAGITLLSQRPDALDLAEPGAAHRLAALFSAPLSSSLD